MKQLLDPLRQLKDWRKQYVIRLIVTGGGVILVVLTGVIILIKSPTQHFAPVSYGSKPSVKTTYKSASSSATSNTNKQSDSNVQTNKTVNHQVAHSSAQGTEDSSVSGETNATPIIKNNNVISPDSSVAYACPSGSVAISADGTVCTLPCTAVQDMANIAEEEYYPEATQNLSQYEADATITNEAVGKYNCKNNGLPLPIPPFQPGQYPALPPIDDNQTISMQTLETALGV